MKNADRHSRIAIEPAQEPDVDQIRSVAVESWHATYKDIFPREFIDRFVAGAYAPHNLRASLHDPGSVFLVARDAGRVVAFCHVGLGPDGTQLFRIYAHPRYWGSGIGARLLKELETILVARSIASYFCYVHARNEVGKRFYFKMGFRHDASKDKEAGDEWYMYKALPGGLVSSD